MLRNKFCDAVAMTTKESGVYDLRCLSLPVPLSEIAVPERSRRFGATRGDEAEPFLGSSAVSRQRPRCTPLSSSLAAAESAEGKAFAWLEQPCRSQVSPGSSLSCCPCPEQVPGSDISLCHGSCGRKGTTFPVCKQGEMR